MERQPERNLRAMILSITNPATCLRFWNQLESPEKVTAGTPSISYSGRIFLVEAEDAEGVLATLASTRKVNWECHVRGSF